MTTAQTLPVIPEPIVEYVEDTDPLADEVIVPTVTLRDRRFRVREQGVSLLALMKFAVLAKKQAAKRQQDPTAAGGDDMEGLAALYALLRSCIHDDDWSAFEDHANDVGAGSEDLMHVVKDAVQAAAARPTQPLSGSLGGQSTTGPSSAGGSSGQDLSGPIRQGDPRVQTLLEQRGRPDLALVVMRAREASTTS
jgi:hypothetical protein